MITKIITEGKQQNGKLYADFFEDASKVLGAETEEEYIKTLNEYFQHLPDLINSDGFEPRYMILPLDEPPFEIKANERKIEVPSVFSKCASVQGDAAAETIYFIIDRYFDTMDLNNQKICIEWRTENGDPHLDAEVFRDIVSQPDKIIFGWALSEEVTREAGDVTFAVRFYTTGHYIDSDTGNEDPTKTVLRYSFSTLPQKITIKPSLATDLMDDTIPVANSTNLLLHRIIKSTPDKNDGGVADPIIMEIRNVDGDKKIANASGMDILNIPDGTSIIIDPVEKVAYGYIQARSVDAGKISCELIGTYVNKPESHDNLKVAYLPTTDVKAMPFTDYWIKNDKVIDDVGVSTYTKYEVEAGTTFPVQDLDGDDIELYEEFYEFKIDSVGEYKIKVTNRRMPSTASIFTAPIKVPAPETPQVDVAIQHLKLSEVNSLSVVKDPEYPHFVNDGGVITYQWYTAASTDPSAALTVLPEETNAALSISEENIYVLKLSNTLNNETRTGEACTYYVSNEPETVTVSLSSDYGSETSYIGNTLSARVSNYNANSKLPREFQYAWYKIAVQGGAQDPEVDHAVGSNISAFKPTESGRYYVVVTNIYNGFYADPVVSNVIAVV